MTDALLKPFLHGAVCMACFTIALFFFRFWRRTHDRFFLLFGFAFMLLMLERIVLVSLGVSHEFAPFVYVARLLGFALIIGAVIDKNRQS